jgi:hypothetical protein
MLLSHLSGRTTELKYLVEDWTHHLVIKKKKLGLLTNNTGSIDSSKSLFIFRGETMSPSLYFFLQKVILTMYYLF